MPCLHRYGDWIDTILVFGCRRGSEGGRAWGLTGGGRAGVSCFFFLCWRWVKEEALRYPAIPEDLRKAVRVGWQQCVAVGMFFSPLTQQAVVSSFC